jgi:hypothetical protein
MNPEHSPEATVPGLFPAFLADLRAIIEQAVESAMSRHVEQDLSPLLLLDVREYRRVELVEENGKRFRGMLYAVKEDGL